MIELRRTIAALLLLPGLAFANDIDMRFQWLSSQTQEAVMEEMQAPYFPYPVKVDQAKELAQRYDNHVPIFSYGSLLNRESASRTLSERAFLSLQPALAFGVQRVFDRDVPARFITRRWGDLQTPEATGMLNLHETGDSSDFVNGVVFYLEGEDLEAVLDRETGYDLYPVIVIRWDEAMDPENCDPIVSIAYTFRAAQEAREGVQYTNPNISPVPNYARASQAGALDYGCDFLKVWNATTYLADGTPFNTWDAEQKVLSPLKSGH